MFGLGVQLVIKGVTGLIPMYSMYNIIDDRTWRREHEHEHIEHKELEN